MIGRLSRWARREPLSLGERGELAAAAHLKGKGFRVLARNVRLASGEIDLLAESPDRSSVVVVEVKARAVQAGEQARLPERQITRAKAGTLAGLAADVSRRRGVSGRPVRIDVVAVEFVEGERSPREIRHYENAIDAGGERF